MITIWRKRLWTGSWSGVASSFSTGRRCAPVTSTKTYCPDRPYFPQNTGQNFRKPHEIVAGLSADGWGQYENRHSSLVSPKSGRKPIALDGGGRSLMPAMGINALRQMVGPGGLSANFLCEPAQH